MSNRPAASDDETLIRMRRQKRSGTKPEALVRRLVRDLGHRYRLNSSTLAGSPDISNKSRGWAIFVHGCYWHHHEGCSRVTVPKRNRDWWLAKFGRNQERDAAKIRALKEGGLRVMVIWECELREPETVRYRLAEWLGPGPSSE